MAVGSVKILLVIVLLLGLVLIFGYHKLTLGFWISDDDEKQTSDDSGLIFHLRRGGFTHTEIILDEAELVSASTDDVVNRTETAQNQDIVIFNRVPKTGSEMFQEFTKLLGQKYGYHTYIDPTPMTFFPGSRYETYFASKFNATITDSGVFLRHMTFFNFTAFHMNSPIYLSMIRHPIERVSSWFYYVRWKNRPDEQLDENVCDKNPTWRDFCDKFMSLRQQELLQTDSWFDLDFDTCVLSNHSDCNFSPGQGGWQDWRMGREIATGNEVYVPIKPVYSDYRFIL